MSLAERVETLRREYLEAQERNLMKTYGRYENECTRRLEKDNEEYEKFNNFQTSPQRVPENLSYKYPDSNYFVSEPTLSVEKPLDLTGEKETGLSDKEMESEKVESSPKHPKRGRGRKSGNKKGDSEVRTSPRFRKSVKSRKNESETKENVVTNENRDAEESTQNGISCRVICGSRDRVASELEVSERTSRNVDPRLRNNTSYIKNESFVEDTEIALLDNGSHEVKMEIDLKSGKLQGDTLSRTNSQSNIVVKGSDTETVLYAVSNKANNSGQCNLREEQLTEDIKKEQTGMNIVLNGFEESKVDHSTVSEDKSLIKKEESYECEEKLVKNEPAEPENSGVEPPGEAKSEDGEQYSSVSADRSAPTKRKVSY